MRKIINQNIKIPVQTLGRKEMTLRQLGDKLNMEREPKDRVMLADIHKLLKENYLISSKSSGRTYLIKLNGNGIYYLNLFNRLDKR